MNLTDYTLTLTASFIGLILGIILAYIAKEELRPGKKYLILLQKLTLTLIMIFMFYQLKLNIYLLIISSWISALVIYLFIERIKTNYIYPVLALIFYLSSRNIVLLKIQAFLIFLYGFPTGSLLTKVTKKNYISTVLEHISYMVIALFLFFIS